MNIPWNQEKPDFSGILTCVLETPGGWVCSWSNAGVFVPSNMCSDEPQIRERIVGIGRSGEVPRGIEIGGRCYKYLTKSEEALRYARAVSEVPTETVSVDDGKYTFVDYRNGQIDILRYGKPWIEECPGSNALSALMARVKELEVQERALQARVKELEAQAHLEAASQEIKVGDSVRANKGSFKGRTGEVTHLYSDGVRVSEGPGLGAFTVNEMSDLERICTLSAPCTKGSKVTRTELQKEMGMVFHRCSTRLCVLGGVE